LEDDRFLAFLDVFPLVEGHTLVIPKIEVDYIFDLTDDWLGDMMVFSKKAATMIKCAYPCQKIGVSVIGLEVPHAHIHLIPLHQVSDMNFSRAKLSPTQTELSQTAAKIRAFA
jgi:histidine triad (HIT) family protein